MAEDLISVPLVNTFWVIPGKLLAGEHPGDTDVELARKKLGALLDAGIRSFVDLTDEDEINEDAKPVPSYRSILRDLAEERRTDITFLRIPVVDRSVPSVWTMRCILDVIDRCTADDNPTFVHCWAGRGRTGSVIGCYLQRHGLATRENVLEKLAELRKHMPTGRESCPHTHEQIRIVCNWKRGA